MSTAALLTAAPDPADRTWPRLAAAVVLSLLLHLALLMGVPVNPTGGVPSVSPVITARLESAPVAAESTNETPSPDTTTVAEPGKVVVTPEPTVEPAQKKPEPEPQAKPVPPPPPSSPSTGIDVPLIRDPTFYAAKQLDAYPQPLTPVHLSYPDAALANRVLEGTVLLLLLIDEFGVVSDVSVIEAQPPGYFEEAAIAVFRNARFSPGMRQGRAVKSRLPFRIRYTAEDPDKARQ